MGRTRSAGFTVFELCIATSVGALVLTGGIVLVQSASTVQTGVVAESRSQNASRVVFDALREAVSMSSLSHVQIKDLPDGNQSIEVDYVIGHLFSLPVWGAYSRGVGELVPASSVLGSAGLGSDYAAVAAHADDLAEIERLRGLVPKAVGYTERYFTVTSLDADANRECRLYRASITGSGNISSVESIARLYAGPDRQGFLVEKRGDSVAVTCNLLGSDGKVTPVELLLLPRN